jgi:putative DNA primase/helicase
VSHQDDLDAALRATAPRALIVTRASDITRADVTYLWRRRLARGKFILIAGDAGLGKSWVVDDLHARLSTGTAWPDEHDARAPVASILLSAEDGPADTIKQRLEAQGANQDLVHVVVAVREGGADDVFSLGTDLGLLEAAVRETKAVFVSVDPLNAYLSVRDSFKDTDIRRALAPLSAFAERTGVTVVCIMHLTKDVDRQALYRILGSIGYVAAARVVHLVVKDPNEAGRRYFLQIKNNLAKVAAPLAFTLEELPEEGARLVWSTDVPPDLDIEALVRGVLPPSPDEAAARRAAQDFLRQTLEAGPEWSAVILKAATHNGVARRTLFRAKLDLGIRAKKVGQPGTSGQGWYWRLPSMPETPPTTAPPTKTAHEEAPKRVTGQGSLALFDNSAVEKTKRIKDLTKSATTQSPVTLFGTPGAPLPDPCRVCGGRRRWRSTHGRTICARCHPPGDPTMVAEWLDG